MLAFTKDSAPPSFRTLLQGRSCKAQLYVKRIPISQIPYEDETKSAQWLQKLFQEKVNHFFSIQIHLPKNLISGSYLRTFYPK